MKKTFKTILVTLTIVFLSTVAFSEDNMELNILFTHDMHDNLESFNTLIDGEKENIGGYSRLSSAIKEEREKDNELLLVDAGDYSMGTLYQTIYETHSPSLRLMGIMGYDAVTLGNHEFDFRPEGLANSLESAIYNREDLPEIIASNTKFPEYDLSNDLIYLKQTFEKYGILDDYLILEKNKIRIGIIGLMGEEADSTAPKAGVKFTDIVEESKELVTNLKEENVDLIVALSHSGTEGKSGKTEDEILAKKVPEIDVIISGHSHTELEEPIIINDTIIASSGKYTENLGTMKIKRENGKWVLKNYDIKRLDNSYKKDPLIDEYVDEFKDTINQDYLSRYGLEYDQLVARSDFNFTSTSELAKEQEEEPLGYLIGDAYRYAVEKAEGKDYENIDVAVVPAGVIRDSFTKGDITVKDIFKVSSLGIGEDQLSGYPLIDVYLTGEELKTAAEVDASIQPLMNVAQLYMSGLQYTFNPNRIIFNKLTDINLLTEDGPKNLEDDKLYRVVANLYSAQMLNIVGDQSMGLLSIVPKDKSGNPIEDFEGRIIYDGDQELKEWIALTQYISSFPEKDGIPHIDQHYAEKQGFKTIDNDKSLTSILTGLNKISLAIILIPIVLIIVLIVIIRFLMNRRERRR